MMDKDFFDRFRILYDRSVGSGAYGKVYSGIEKDSGSVVAIKTVHDLQTVENEVEVMKAYGKHENLPEFYGVGERDGVAYVAMELIEGGQLGNYLFGYPRDQGFVSNVMDSILGALSAVHSSGSIHLDVNPQNILVKNSKGKGSVLVDFGTARRTDSLGFWRRWVRGGTYEYMAPEQRIDKTTLSSAVDVYSAAGIGFYLLTGQAPFMPDLEKFGNPLELGGSSQEYRQECLRLKKDPGSALRLGRSDLESTLLTCLSYDPNKRLSSALEFREVLRGMS